MLARFPCHPLDTIKTVQFTSDASGGRSSFAQTVRVIYSREGVAGFYRGVGIATCGSAPGVALYLTTYTRSCKWFDEQLSAGDSPFVHLICGFLAEAVSCVFWVPIDVVKERLQSQPPSLQGRYTGSANGVRTVLANEKLLGLYRGYFSTLASFGPYSAIYFMSFERVRLKLFGPATNSSFYQTLVAAGVANAIAGWITNPLELVKTRLQVQRSVLSVGSAKVVSSQFVYSYSGIVSGVADIVKQEGLLGLWRGVGARVIYTAPNAALTMAMYEGLQSFLK